VLWLKVDRTNNDPAVVDSYYIDFIREITGKLKHLIAFIVQENHSSLIHNITNIIK
jgi:hypothetical protein